MNKKIVVIGSSNTDMIVKVPHIPAPGETILGGDFTTAAGGKGANQAVAAARTGGEVVFVTCLGEDDFGKHALTGYQKEKIDTSLVKITKEKPSGIAMINVAGNGENSISVAPGANSMLQPEDLRNALPKINNPGMIIAQLEIPLETVIEAGKMAKELGIPFILNPAPARELPEELLGYATILTPNESEAELLTGMPVNSMAEIEAAAENLKSKGVTQVIITLGKQGAYVDMEGFQGVVPGFTVKAMDTTAAGDVFNGALGVALLENQNISDAIRFAHAAAAISVTKLGAQPSVPAKQDVQEFLEKN